MDSQENVPQGSSRKLARKVNENERLSRLPSIDEDSSDSGSGPVLNSDNENVSPISTVDTYLSEIGPGTVSTYNNERLSCIPTVEENASDRSSGKVSKYNNERLSCIPTVKENSLDRSSGKVSKYNNERLSCIPTVDEDSSDSDSGAVSNYDNDPTTTDNDLPPPPTKAMVSWVTKKSTESFRKFSHHQQHIFKGSVNTTYGRCCKCISSRGRSIVYKRFVQISEETNCRGSKRFRIPEVTSEDEANTPPEDETDDANYFGRGYWIVHKMYEWWLLFLDKMYEWWLLFLNFVKSVINYLREKIYGEKSEEKNEKDTDKEGKENEKEEDKEKKDDEEKDDGGAEIIVGRDQISWRANNQSDVVKRDQDRYTILELKSNRKDKKSKRLKAKKFKPLGTRVYHQQARCICTDSRPFGKSVKVVVDFVNKMAFVEIISFNSQIRLAYNVEDMNFMATSSEMEVAWIGDVYGPQPSPPQEEEKEQEVNGEKQAEENSPVEQRGSTSRNNDEDLDSDSCSVSSETAKPIKMNRIVQIVFCNVCQSKRFRSIVDTLKFSLSYKPAVHHAVVSKRNALECRSDISDDVQCSDEDNPFGHQGQPDSYQLVQPMPVLTPYWNNTPDYDYSEQCVGDPHIWTQQNVTQCRRPFYCTGTIPNNFCSDGSRIVSNCKVPKFHPRELRKSSLNFVHKNNNVLES